MTDPAADTAATYDAERPRLVALAYRMLGTPDDADDVVQDAWLRWSAADHASIEEPAAWLTTVTTRLAIDRLRSARHRREVYVGPWLPEPVAEAGDPYLAAASADSLTLAFLTVLERLEPVERAVLLLHDVFGYPFADVAAHVDRTEAAARQIAKRARERVRSAHPRVDPAPDRATAERLAEAFFAAVAVGDVDGLRAMLTDDVVHLSDGGPMRRAARRPVVGPDRVARLFLNLAARTRPGTRFDPLVVNGQPGLYATVDGEPEVLFVPAFRGERVSSILAVLNPDKLARVHAAWLAAR